LAEESRKSIRVEIYEDELAKIAMPATPDAGRPPSGNPHLSVPAPTLVPTPKP
jgi:hypothetical protein